MTEPRLRVRTFTLCAALVAGLGVAAAYAGRVDIGLYYDDYHFAHPWTPTELHRVWFGSWDPAGIESMFYRPLTALLFAWRFNIFGLNATAMHFVSVVGHGLCAVLVAWILRRERTRDGAALFGAWLYAVHPLFPYAQVSWVTNQMHLAQSLIVLSALTLWQTARDRSPIWWIPIALLAVVGFLLKEDGVMLLPVVAILTALRVWLLGVRPPRGWIWLLAAAVLIVAMLVGLRYDRLGQLGGYGRPDVDRAWTNGLKGLNTALFLWPTTRIWQAVASAIATVAVLGALVLGWRARTGRFVLIVGVLLAGLMAFNILPAFNPGCASCSVFAWQGLASGVAISVLVLGLGAGLSARRRDVLFVMGMGLAITLCFNLPFVLVSKREQYHLLALGAVIAFTGAGEAIRGALAAPMRRRVVSIALVIATLPWLMGARHTSADFLPCAAKVLSNDTEARRWWIVPDEIRAWMDVKEGACAAGAAPPRVSNLPVVSWGVYGEEREGSTIYRWTSDRVVILAGGKSTAMTVSVRHPRASRAKPVVVVIGSGRTTQRLTLQSPDWTEATVAFQSGPLTWLRQAHRVDLVVDPWFVPAVEDFRSQDLRRIGVQFRVSDIR